MPILHLYLNIINVDLARGFGAKTFFGLGFGARGCRPVNQLACCIRLISYSRTSTGRRCGTFSVKNLFMAGEMLAFPTSVRNALRSTRSRAAASPTRGTAEGNSKLSGNTLVNAECISLVATGGQNNKSPSPNTILRILEANSPTIPCFKDPLVPFGSLLGFGSVKNKLKVES